MLGLYTFTYIPANLAWVASVDKPLESGSVSRCLQYAKLYEARKVVHMMNRLSGNLLQIYQGTAQRDCFVETTSSTKLDHHQVGIVFNIFLLIRTLICQGLSRAIAINSTCHKRAHVGQVWWWQVYWLHLFTIAYLAFDQFPVGLKITTALCTRMLLNFSIMQIANISVDSDRYRGQHPMCSCPSTLCKSGLGNTDQSHWSV